MKFTRLYTRSGSSVEDQIEWKRTDAKITDANGATIFEMNDIEVPAAWSETATNILAQKYFRKAGVPNEIIASTGRNGSVPYWLVPRKPKPGASFGAETSARAVFNRLAGCWTYWGWTHGYFKKAQPLGTEEYSAKVFYDELYFMLAMQIAAPNSPQWFNTGLWWAYGIEGPDSGQWFVDYDGDSVTPPGAVYPASDSYVHPQPHACFIQPVDDDLVNAGGIMDLWVREVRLFKHGSGTGSNFSSLRSKGEKLSGGGVSSGLMSFLKIGDAAAGAIKSGGVTRRAAKMVVLDLDHPEVEAFIDWKVSEEDKARALVAAGYSEAEALETISGQNSNNSVRVRDMFLSAVDADGRWGLYNRVDGKEARVLSARELWQRICSAAWHCGDPGVQFHDTINDWNTCPNDGTINASNPCGEYLFLDNTACNLASLNLVKFDVDTKGFDYKRFEHAVRFWTTVLDISVTMASFPSAEIAEGSYSYRTLGLGYANLGGLLMRNAIAYDSDEGRKLAAEITAVMNAEAYRTSVELAAELGAFPRYEANAEQMRSVIKKHNKAFTDLASTVAGMIPDCIGFRNAQVTLIAPTGTIALLMDCDTTGIEPDFALVKTKVLAGGGTMKLVNAAVPIALRKLGYTATQIREIEVHIKSTGTIHGMAPKDGEPFVAPEHLPIFACAVGESALAPEAHVKMVAAVQPFLSGGISKTVNMPNSATVDDIDRIYRLAHELGLKSVSVYRDGCKLNQPLSTMMETISLEPKAPYFISDMEIERYEPIRPKMELKTRGMRLPLPSRRSGYTQKVRVNGMTLYSRTGEYPDGTLGEIFIDISEEGSTLRSLANCFAKAISIGLQFGVPLSEFVDAFVRSQFEPAGIVEGHDTIKMCSSIVSLIFRDLAMSYLGESKAEVAPIEVSLRQQKSGAPETTSVISGTPCPECGALLIQTGSCKTCPNCSFNSGCG